MPSIGELTDLDKYVQGKKDKGYGDVVVARVSRRKMNKIAYHANALKHRKCNIMIVICDKNGDKIVHDKS